MNSTTIRALMLSAAVLALTVGSTFAQQTTGTPGSPDATATIDGRYLPPPDQPFQGQINLNAWGSAETYPHYAVGWAWAFDTPYKWTKQIPSFFGGTRNGVAISWPGHITDKGGIRNQFSHVIDIVPTILEAIGIPAPVMVDGIGQKPIEGVSMAYTFDKTNADAPSRHRTQYFEMFSVQGLYNDGWMLSAVPNRAPWDLLGKVTLDPATAYKFELYDVQHDWTQYTDVAAAKPQKVQEMKDLMFGEFAKYQVLPLDASVTVRAVLPRPSLAGGRQVFTYSGATVTGILKVDGKVVATQTMDRTTPAALPIDENFDIGADTGSPVDDHDYQVPFAFTGKIDKLTIALDPPKLTPDDLKKLEAAYQAAQDAK